MQILKQCIAANTGSQIQIIKQAHKYKTGMGQSICKQNNDNNINLWTSGGLHLVGYVKHYDFGLIPTHDAKT